MQMHGAVSLCRYQCIFLKMEFYRHFGDWHVNFYNSILIVFEKLRCKWNINSFPTSQSELTMFSVFSWYARSLCNSRQGPLTKICRQLQNQPSWRFLLEIAIMLTWVYFQNSIPAVPSCFSDQSWLINQLTCDNL